MQCAVDLHVKFPDGGLCVISHAPELTRDGDFIYPDDDEYDEEDIISYFPSMEIAVDDLGRNLFRTAKWINGAYKRTYKKGVHYIHPLNVTSSYITLILSTYVDSC